MYQHVIITHGSHSEEKRIGLHKYCEKIDDIGEFMILNSKLNDMFEHLTFGFHHIQTVDDSIESILEYDYFFEGIEFYEDYDKFVSLIKEDITIQPTDVIKLILSRRNSSPLELQKLVYFVYCEYLKMFGEEMFVDDFEAWDYGPVIPEIYYSLQKYGKSEIVHYNDPEIMAELQSRIIKFEEHDKLLKAIDRTIEKYGDLKGFQLVDKTHIPDSPWNRVYRRGRNEVISKEILRDYAFNQ